MLNCLEVGGARLRGQEASGLDLIVGLESHSRLLDWKDTHNIVVELERRSQLLDWKDTHSC